MAVSFRWRSKSCLQLVFGLLSPTLEHLWGEVNGLGKQHVFLMAVTSLVLNVPVSSLQRVLSLS